MTTVKAVIGANYGDEGKGLMTDYFANEAKENNQKCLVVCNNGGAQRGHTVRTPDMRRMVFHHFGSGTFAGADTYFSKYFIVNPVLFMEDWQELKDIDFKCYVDFRCLCSTPYDMMLNQIVEESRDEGRHGSCGVGIWETIVRNGKTFFDMCMMTDKELKNYLLEIRDDYCGRRLEEYGIGVPEYWEEIFYSDGLIEHYINDFKNMKKRVQITTDDLVFKKYNYGYIIFENGQGLLLDQSLDEKYSTPSNTGFKNIKEMLRVIPDYDLELCYVTRSYITRHGNGPFETECDMKDLEPGIIDRTNVWNKNQGTLRYGKLNFEEMYNRVKADAQGENFTIAMTHINEYFTFSDFWEKINYYSYLEIRDGVEKVLRGDI